MARRYRRKRRNCGGMTAATHLRNVSRGFAKRGASPEQVSDMQWLARGITRGTTCLYCQAGIDGVTFSLDHKLPISRGGSHALYNLAICCKRCNMAKGAMNDEEYLALLYLLRTFYDGGESVLRRLVSSGNMFRRRR